MEISNPKGSATSSCLHNAEKLGTTKATEKRGIRNPGEIWITSLATSVEKKVIMLGKINDQIKPGSKKMQRHSGK